MIETMTIECRLDKSHIYWGEVIAKRWVGRYLGEEILGYIDLSPASNLYRVLTSENEHYLHGDEMIQFFSLTKPFPGNIIWIDLT